MAISRKAASQPFNGAVGAGDVHDEDGRLRAPGCLERRQGGDQLVAIVVADDRHADVGGNGI